MNQRRYAFVVPRFGQSIAGGMETLVGNMAERLQARGHDVVVLTTCARDNRTWANEFPAGPAIEYGVKVMRFLVNDRDVDAWAYHQIRLNDGVKLSVDDQLEWMQHSVGSDELYRYLLEHQQKYDAIFFAPYLFGTTFWGSQLVPSKAILIPCLHDEQNAYLEVIASMFRGVRGAVFNAEPECDLAQRLYGNVPGGAVGMGFELPGIKEVQELKPYLAGSDPYLLYVGRKETGKNAHLLIDYFCALKEQAPDLQALKLVLVGAGSFSDLHRPKALERGDIIDIGHVSELEKRRLIRHALALTQPSTNESFSIVLMEAWQVETPVLVHAACPVTKTHVVKSGGGLYFGNAADLVGVVRALHERPQLARQMGQSGRRYVAERFNWEAVLDRFDHVVSQVL
jgi:glycosyltransferase involved in cell wall biosynthesis